MEQHSRNGFERASTTRFGRGSPGKKLLPRHERPGYVPDPPAAPSVTEVIRQSDAAKHLQNVQRDIDTRRASQEARERVAVPPEPPHLRLWQMLGASIMVQWTLIELNPHVIFSITLTRTFGNEYRPLGVTVAIRRGEERLKLLVDPNMVWVNTPKNCPDMRSVLFVKTALHPQLIELCERGPIEELEVVLSFAPYDAAKFAVSRAAASPKVW